MALLGSVYSQSDVHAHSHVFTHTDAIANHRSSLLAPFVSVLMSDTLMTPEESEVAETTVAKASRAANSYMFNARTRLDVSVLRSCV